MQFGLIKEQIDIQKAAGEFAEKEFREVARELDSKEIEKIIIGRKLLGTH